MDLIARLRDDNQNGAPDLAWEAADALEGAKVLRRALVQQIKRLTEALAEANDVLRSTYQIAARSGAETNWPPFTGRVQEVLKKQHAILHAQPDEDGSPTTKCGTCGIPLTLGDTIPCAVADCPINSAHG